jgi:hypothetical protein
VSFNQHLSTAETTSVNTATTASNIGGFNIYEETVALNMFDRTADDVQVQRLMDDAEQIYIGEETVMLTNSSVRVPDRVTDISSSNMEEVKKDGASHAISSHGIMEKRRTTLDMLSGLDPLDMTNDESVDEHEQKSFKTNAMTIDLMRGGEFSSDDEEEEEEKMSNQHRNVIQKNKIEKVVPKSNQPTFSIFEDVFAEHEDIQKDRRATLLGDRLDGISEGTDESTSSNGGRSSRSSNSNHSEHDQDSGRRTSMDSLQGVGDLSSICCEEEEDETMSRRWSGLSSTPGGFSIFTE